MVFTFLLPPWNVFWRLHLVQSFCVKFFSVELVQEGINCFSKWIAWIHFQLLFQGYFLE